MKNPQASLPNPDTHQMDIQYTFHVYGNHSIGYLHMHIYDGNLLTKAYEEMQGDTKNTPVEVVQKWLNTMKHVGVS